MTTPVRIQLSRKKGWRMPENTVKVDRSTPWGNPWRIGMWRGYAAEDAVKDFRRWLLRDPSVRSAEHAFGSPPSIDAIKSKLRGKNLACWCGHGPCHADVLLELANQDQPA
jgi:hypothetical protein